MYECYKLWKGGPEFLYLCLSINKVKNTQSSSCSTLHSLNFSKKNRRNIVTQVLILERSVGP